MKQPARGKLAEGISEVLVKNGTEDDFDYIAGNFQKLPLSDAKFEALQPFARFLAKVNDTDKFRKGVDMIVSFREAIPATYQSQTTPFINNIVLKGIVTQKNAALKSSTPAMEQQIDYINKATTPKKGL